jgi:hypothetical protein
VRAVTDNLDRLLEVTEELKPASTEPNEHSKRRQRRTPDGVVVHRGDGFGSERNRS